MMRESSVQSPERETHAAPSTLTAAFTDASDDARFVLMKSLRLVIAIVWEASMFALLIPAVWTCIMSVMFAISFGTENMQFNSGVPVFDFITYHCFLSAAFFTTAVVFAYVQYLAVGVPYRFNVQTPGLRTKTCWACGNEIPDELHCPSCKAFRLGRVFTAIVWAASLVVTLLWAIHDIVLVLFTAVGFAKGSKR